MGLDTFATGLSHDDNFHGSYGRYSAFIEELINHVYGTKCREIFRRGLCDGFCDGKYIGPLTEEDMSIWNSQSNDDLNILIYHPDDSGQFSPDECRKIYNAIKDIQFDLDTTTYSGKSVCETLEKFKKIFRHCARRRVNLYYR